MYAINTVAKCVYASCACALLLVAIACYAIGRGATWCERQIPEVITNR